MSRPAPPAPAVRRARILLLMVFGLNGFMGFASLARFPSIRDALELSVADLGMALLIGSLGALATVLVSPRLMHRWGSERVLVMAALTHAAGYSLMGVGPALGRAWLFEAGVLLQGVGGALFAVALNLESTRVEKAVGRTCVPHFHAAFSATAILGSVVGATCSWLGVAVVWQFTIIGVLAAILRLAAVAAGLVLPALPVELAAASSEARQAHTGRLASVWREPRTLLIGVVAFAAGFLEGTANNWLSVATVDGLDQPEAIGGLMMGILIGAMTLVRVLGATLIDRYGRVLVLRACGVTSLAGVVLFALGPGLGFAVAGAILWGAGAALCFPIAVAAASDHPWRAADRVAVMSSLATVSGLVGPPLVGIMAGLLGVRHALLFVLVAIAGVLLVARRVAPLAGRRPAAIRELEPVSEASQP